VEAIPGYLIDRKLSSGGTAGVYRALDIEAGYHVALKILFPKWNKDPQALALMDREAWFLKSLKHAHVVRGLASGCWRDLHWTAMEWVAGPTALQRLYSQGPFAATALFELARQMAEALRFLWSRGIVHGDVKPANILLAPGGVAKLCDFGFAQVVRGPGAEPLAGPFGTVAYASPEQVEGREPLDARADLYGLGATLYHLATNRMPPVPDPWGALPAFHPSVAPEVRWLLHRLMAPDRRDRTASADTLLLDLEHLHRMRARPRRPALKPGEFHIEFN
jgi:serine/threonine-protein kinase